MDFTYAAAYLDSAPSLGQVQGEFLPGHSSHGQDGKMQMAIAPMALQNEHLKHEIDNPEDPHRGCDKRKLQRQQRRPSQTRPSPKPKEKKNSFTLDDIYVPTQEQLVSGAFLDSPSAFSKDKHRIFAVVFCIVESLGGEPDNFLQASAWIRDVLLPACVLIFKNNDTYQMFAEKTNWIVSQTAGKARRCPTTKGICHRVKFWRQVLAELTEEMVNSKRWSDRRAAEVRYHAVVVQSHQGKMLQENSEPQPQPQQPPQLACPGQLMDWVAACATPASEQSLAVLQDLGPPAEDLEDGCFKLPEFRYSPEPDDGYGSQMSSPTSDDRSFQGAYIEEPMSSPTSDDRSFQGAYMEEPMSSPTSDNRRFQEAYIEEPMDFTFVVDSLFAAWPLLPEDFVV